jgi:hypothetical protein
MAMWARRKKIVPFMLSETQVGAMVHCQKEDMSDWRGALFCAAMPEAFSNTDMQKR